MTAPSDTSPAPGLESGRRGVDPYAALVADLRATFASGRTRSHEWRDRQLQGLARLLDERRDDIGAALVRDLRRGEFESTLLDIVPTKAEVAHTRKHLRSWMRPTKVKVPMSGFPGRAWHQPDPLGVVLVISPWNYPIHLALTPLITALAAGNCVVIKPSEVTPATSQLMQDLLPLYLDPDAVKVVLGGPEASLGLIAAQVDHVFFTGSPAVGRIIMAAAAEHLTPVTLELGGKCPAIVTGSADLEVAARRIAFGKVTNSGQTCVAPDYVLVDRTVRDEFLGHLTEALKKFSESRPVPIVNSRHAARLAGLLETSGGRVALGGTVDVEAAEAPMTVVVDPRSDAPLLAEEIFGPLLPVVTVDSLADAVAHVQRGTHPLATYLFTKDRADEESVLEHVRTGGTVVNHVMLHLGVNDLPFGGVGESGMGKYHGKWGFDVFSNPKAVLRKPNRPDVPLLYPPYGRLTRKILSKLV